MKIKFTVQFIFRELFTKKEYPLQILLAIAIGVGAVTGINSYKENLYTKIEKESLNIMGSDLVVQSNSPITKNKNKFIKENMPRGSSYSEMIKFSSMIYAKDTKENSLGTIKAIESNFPFYGEVITSPQNAYYDLQVGEILLEESLVKNLNVKIGEKIGVGETDFVFKGTIIKEPISSGSYYAMAPTCLIKKEDVAKTKLETRGSRIRYAILIKLPNNVNSLKLKNNIFKKFIEKDLIVYHHREAGSRSQKFITNTLDYMSFLGLTAMFIGAVSIILTCRKKVKEKINEIAVLKCLGARSWFYIVLFLLELTFISSIGTTIGIGFGYAIQYLMPNIKGLEFILEVEPNIGIKPLIGGIAIGLALPILVSFESIYKIGRVSPLLAIRSNFEVDIKPKLKPRLQSVLEILFILILFTSIAFFEIQDFQKTAILCLVLLSIPFLLFILYLIFRVLIKVFLKLFRLPKHFYFILRKIEQTGNGLSIVIPGVGTSLIILILALVMEASILNTGGGFEQIEERPNVFAMDIREEQIENFHEILSKYEVEKKMVAPVINARLSKINGKPIQKEDTETDALKRDWKSTAKTREYFLSYRKKLYDTEKILEGEFWSHKIESQISIEKEFSKALGVSVGDTLEFDVQGIPVSGTITNIRIVQWVDMKPNFVVIFSPGPLNQAPAYSISSFRLASAQDRYNLQKEIISIHPNITIIDMEKAIGRFTNILKKMTRIVQMMTLFILVSSLLLFVTTLNTLHKERVEEAVLLKVVGGTSRILRKIYSMEAVLITIFTFLFAIALSVITSSILLNYYLNLYVIFPWIKIGLVFGFVLLLVISTYLLHIQEVVKKSPSIVLDKSS